MFAVSSRGTLAYVSESLGNPLRELVWLDRTGRATPAIGEQPPLPLRQPLPRRPARRPHDPGREPRPLDLLVRARHPLAPHERRGDRVRPRLLARRPRALLRRRPPAFRAPPDRGRRARHRDGRSGTSPRRSTRPGSPSPPTAARSPSTRHGGRRPAATSTRGRSTAARRRARSAPPAANELERLVLSRRPLDRLPVERDRAARDLRRAVPRPGREGPALVRRRHGPALGEATARSSTCATTSCGSSPPRLGAAPSSTRPGPSSASRSSPAPIHDSQTYDVTARRPAHPGGDDPRASRPRQFEVVTDWTRELARLAPGGGR